MAGHCLAAPLTEAEVPRVGVGLSGGPRPASSMHQVNLIRSTPILVGRGAVGGGSFLTFLTKKWAARTR